ncbi:hypothetical protein Tco_0111005 [Tanacetum coccineum]
MLLLIDQNKLFNLEGDVIVDFVTALKMFTRRIIIQNRVDDVQLGVESYQRKLNLTKPQRTCPHISVKEPYTLNFDPPGIIYEDKSKKKRIMRIDEIHKFCDGTLQSVRNILRESQNRRDLPRDIPLDRIEVLMYDTKGVKARMGIMQTKTELTLEQTQQGVSNEVLVSIEGVE